MSVDPQELAMARTQGVTGDGGDPPPDATARTMIMPAGSPGPMAPGMHLQAARIGRYAILRTLGEGGMGIVYAAYDEELDRRIALKLLHAEHSGGTEGRARLVREAQALARLSHPNVVQIHEIGEHEGQVFVAMEYVEGVTLQVWQRDRGRPLAAVLDAYRQAGEGLLAAHRAGLVHRDFKPKSRRFSLRTPSSRETPRISSLEGVGGKIGCPGLPLLAPRCPGSWPPLGHRNGARTLNRGCLRRRRCRRATHSAPALPAPTLSPCPAVGRSSSGHHNGSRTEARFQKA